MDASTLAVAALAVAADESREAALRELLLERERAAMQAEDLRSYVAQRHFTTSLLVPRAPATAAAAGHGPMTWEAAYAQRHNDLLEAHDAMRSALLAVRRGNDQRAEEVLAQELGSDEEEEAEEESEESDEEVALVCVLCGREPAGSRRLLTMAAEGRWAGLALEARRVCSEPKASARWSESQHSLVLLR